MNFNSFSEFGIKRPAFQVNLPISKIKLYMRKITLGDEATLAKMLINQDDLYSFILNFLWEHVVDSEPKITTREEFYLSIAEADVNIIFWMLYLFSYVKEDYVPAYEAIMCDKDHVQGIEKIPLKYKHPEKNRYISLYVEKPFDGAPLEFKTKLEHVELFEGKVKWYIGIPTLKKALDVTDRFQRESQPLVEKLEELELKNVELDTQIESLKKDSGSYIDFQSELDELNKMKISLANELLTIRSRLEYLTRLFDDIITYTQKFEIITEKEIKRMIKDEDGNESYKIEKVKDIKTFSEVDDIINAYKDLDKEIKDILGEKIKHLKEYGIKLIYKYKCDSCYNEYKKLEEEIEKESDPDIKKELKNKLKEMTYIYDYVIEPQMYFFRAIPQPE